MNKEDFINEITKLNISLTSDLLDKLSIYYEELIAFNNHTNITSITKKEDVYLKHFYDSLTITKAYNFNCECKVLDIGTGAGFPGVVLKIFFPKIKLVLLDSNNKKTTFLNNLCQKLGLTEVTIINKRAEDHVKYERESFDIVTSRAVAKTRILCELCLPFLKNGGYLILMKASNNVLNQELLESYRTIEILKSHIKKRISFSLPNENSERNLVVIEKQSHIDNVYPRSYDKILKKPLK